MFLAKNGLTQNKTVKNWFWKHVHISTNSLISCPCLKGGRSIFWMCMMIKWKTKGRKRNQEEENANPNWIQPRNRVKQNGDKRSNPSTATMEGN